MSILTRVDMKCFVTTKIEKNVLAQHSGDQTITGTTSDRAFVPSFAGGVNLLEFELFRKNQSKTLRLKQVIMPPPVSSPHLTPSLL